MQLLEILNKRFAGEFKGAVDKTVGFIYSKFSPVETCIRKDKVLLKDMLTIVQTNLMKLYIELKEKDKIYAFFQEF
jgi:hypothetical protein